MVTSRRLQDLVIVLLAIVAVAVSALAVMKVNRPQETTAALGASGSADAVGIVDDASATSGTAEDAEQTTSSGDESTLEAWVDAWAGDADLLVVGDGFSNLPSQWVQLWADRLGDDRPVTIHHWGEAADVSFNPAIQLSDGDGEPLSVWSASRDGSTIHDAAEDYRRFVDASNPPDAVLVSMGLDSGEEDIADGLDQLVAQIDDQDEDVPVLIAIGPDGLYDEGVGDALLTWAEDHADRVAVTDLRGMAPDSASAEEWAVAFQSALDGT